MVGKRLGMGEGGKFREKEVDGWKKKRQGEIFHLKTNDPR